jgi:hypothetical protein
MKNQSTAQQKIIGRNDDYGPASELPGMTGIRIHIPLKNKIVATIAIPYCTIMRKRNK